MCIKKQKEMTEIWQIIPRRKEFKEEILCNLERQHSLERQKFTEIKVLLERKYAYMKTLYVEREIKLSNDYQLKKRQLHLSKQNIRNQKRQAISRIMQRKQIKVFKYKSNNDASMNVITNPENRSGKSSGKQKKKNKPQKSRGNEVETKIFKCTSCSYSTNRKQYLKMHTLTHTGEKPH